MAIKALLKDNFRILQPMFPCSYVKETTGDKTFQLVQYFSSVLRQKLLLLSLTDSDCTINSLTTLLHQTLQINKTFSLHFSVCCCVFATVRKWLGSPWLHPLLRPSSRCRDCCGSYFHFHFCPDDNTLCISQIRD